MKRNKWMKCAFIIAITECLSTFQAITSEMSKPLLSTHILDISIGKPAQNVKVQLYRQMSDSDWRMISEAFTNEDGRGSAFIQNDQFSEGIYKFRFYVSEYFSMRNQETFYPYVEIPFKTVAGQTYHVPLLLSPYGFSTYRGS